MQEHLSELIFITAIAGLNLKITFVMIGGPNKQFNFKKNPQINRPQYIINISEKCFLLTLGTNKPLKTEQNYI